jgi:hypothetical protein
LSGSLKAAIPTDFPSFGAPWIMGGFALLFGRSRISDNLPPVANVAISNVPGAPVPLYMAGAKLATYYPVSIPAHGVALNITVQSYNGSLDYGFTACRRAVPDVDDLIEHLVEAHKELRQLVLGSQPASTAKPLEKAQRPAAEKVTADTPAVPAKRRRAAKERGAKSANGRGEPTINPGAPAKAKTRKSSGKTAPKSPAAGQRAKSKAAEPAAEETAPADKTLN